MIQSASPFLQPIRYNLIRIFIILATSDRPVSGSEMAKELDISISSLEIYLRTIKTSKHIEGTRGVNGGYILKTDPANITVIDIIGKTITTPKDDPAINKLITTIIDFMDETTLQDLLDWSE